MTLAEYNIYIAESDITNLLEAAKSLPSDKLDWKPTPNSRSALDQLQEVATAMQAFLEDIKNQKVSFDKTKFAEWVQSRSQLKEFDQIETALKEGMILYRDYINNLDPAEYNKPVEMPMPGEWRVANLAYYHPWNIAYHLGQINYIHTLLVDQPES